MRRSFRVYSLLLTLLCCLPLAGWLPTCWARAGSATDGAATVVGDTWLPPALYVGGDATFSGCAKVTSPLVNGLPSAALYVGGRLCTRGTNNLSTVATYVGAKGDTVPPFSQFMPDARIALLTSASQVARKTGTVNRRRLHLKGTCDWDFPGPITVGNLTISGSGTYTFDSVYVTGNLVVRDATPHISMDSLHVGGSLTVTGGTLRLGPTYVAGNTSLSGSGQWNVSLLVTKGSLAIGGTQSIGGDGVGDHAMPATMLLTGHCRSMTYSCTGTYSGLLCNPYGGFCQSGYGGIKGSVLCGGSSCATDGSRIAYDPNIGRVVLDATTPTVTINAPQDGSTVFTPTPAFDFTAWDEPGGSGLDPSATTVELDGAVVLAPGPTLGPLADGPHELTVTVRDVAGNPSSDTSHFTVASTPPPSSAFTVAPADPHEGDVIGLFADATGNPEGSQEGKTWTWTVAAAGEEPVTYEGPCGYIVPDGIKDLEVTLSVTNTVSGASSSTMKTITVMPQAPRVHALDVEVLAGGSARLVARFLDPGWTDTHLEAVWTIPGMAPITAQVHEDDLVAMESGSISAATPPLTAGAGPLDCSLTVTDSDGASATDSFVLTVVAAAPDRDEGVNGNGACESATELRGTRTHLAYIQSVDDVDIYRVATTSGQPLPYGTELLATLRDLPADFDLAVIQDLGEQAATEAMQQAAFESSSFANSPFAHTPFAHTPFEESPFAHTPFAHTPFAHTPFAHTPFIDSPFAHTPFAHTPFAHTPFARTPFIDAPFAHTPFAHTPFAHSPFLYLPFAHTPADQTANSLDGFPLSEMSYTGLKNDATAGSDITFEELGFDNEAIEGKIIAGFSATPGTGDEVVLTTVDVVGGATYIAVKGANGASAQVPYTLQVETSQPRDTLSDLNPLEEPLVTVDPTTETTVAVPAAQPGPDTLFVTQAQRIDALYPGGWETVVRPALELACGPNNGLVRGEVISVPSVPYDEWDKEPWKPELANRVAERIRGEIRAYLEQHPTIRYVVLVGSDEVIPQRRVQDQTVIGNERAYAETAFVEADGALFGSMYQSMMLSDDYYVDAEPIPYNGRALYIPDLAVSRLVETPADIATAIDTFFERNGELGGATSIVTGHDFMTDGVARVQNILLGAGLSSELLSGGAWTADDVRQGLLGESRNVGSVNGHFTHFGGLSAFGYEQFVSGAEWDAGELFTGAEIGAAPGFVGKLIFSMGCHAGLNVPDRQAVPVDPSYGVDPSLDLAEAMASRGGVLVGSTGYGYGDTVTVAGTEALIGLFADRMTEEASGPGSSQPIGLALAAAKRQYLGSLSAVTPYDEKSSIQFTMYGMPQYRLPCTTHPATDAGDLQTAAGWQGAGAPVPGLPRTFTLTVVDGDSTTTFAPSLDQITAAAGAYFTAGGDAQATVDRPVQPRMVIDLGLAGENPVKAAFITAGSYVDITAFDPAISRWTTEWEVGPEEYDVATKGWWPADPTTVMTIVTSGGVEQRLVVLPGQFLSTAAAGQTITGTERVWTSLTVELVRAAASNDTVGPTVRGAELSMAGDTVTAKVDASDDTSGIARIDVTRIGGDAASHFSFAPVTPGPDGTYDVSFDLPGVAPADVSVILEVVDGAGNVTTVTSKGALVTVPPPPVTAFWPADGTAGDVVGDHDGTLRGDASFAAGVVGQAFQLDGDGDWIEVPDAPDLNPGTGDFTACLWVNYDDTGGEQVLIEKYVETEDPATREGWTLTKLWDNTIRLQAPSSKLDSEAIDIQAGTWLHVAVRRSAGVCTIFVDGVSVAAGPVPEDLDASASLKLGHRGNPDDTPGSVDGRDLWCHGRFDEVRLWVGRGLSDGEVYDLAHEVTPPSHVARMAGGADHALAIKADGSLWAWGGNFHGQLGLGDTASRAAPTRVGSDGDWTALACGADHTVALKSDGSLWVWGRNDDEGQLGLGDMANRSSPTRLGLENDWTAVSAGTSHTVALKSDGSIWVWGSNYFGQLGDGTTRTRRTTPVRVGSDSDWVAITTGCHQTLALKADGSLWAWGWNERGQLGLGDTTDRSIPTRVGSDSDWAVVVSGWRHALALKRDGSLWVWGANDYGQLGLGDTTDRFTPVRVGSDTDWTSLACGSEHTVALKSDGSLWTWGANYEGQLALGYEDDAGHPSPIRVGTDSDWAAVARVWGRTLAAKSGGSLWSCHYGAEYWSLAWVLDLTDVIAPSGAMVLNGGDAETYSSIARIDSAVSGATHMRMRLDHASWSAWQPYAASAQVALFSDGEHTVWVQYRDAGWNMLELVDTITVQSARIAAGWGHSLAIKADGELWTWGSNARGKLGLGDVVDRLSPQQVGTDSDWSLPGGQERHSVALKAGGSLWAWGGNDWGGLGQGDTTDRSVPTRVGTDTDWAAVACGLGHTVAVKAGGSLWAWGMNWDGQLGLGDWTNRLTPVRVGTDTDWAAAACGDDHTLALKSDGSLWAWGFGAYGQLGLGDMDSRLAPVRVGTDSDWTAVACGDDFSLALKADGSLWAWGDNGSGQVGDGSSDLRIRTPVRVGSDSDWAAVDGGGGHAVAVKVDGSLWAWGWNAHGQLGQGDTADRGVPARVGADTDWEAVAGGGPHTLAMKADGTVWAWGSNEFGELGDGTTTESWVPKRVFIPMGTQLASAGVPAEASAAWFDGPAVSADGRYVAFTSEASNLVAGDTNGVADVFVHDRVTGRTERVSVATGGAQANEMSEWPSISGDGRYVAFTSASSNFVANDTNALEDIFVRDRQTGTTELVSVDVDGGIANEESYTSSISADGRYVAFSSVASDLVPVDSNLRDDIFLRDRQTGTTALVTVASDGTSQADDSSRDPVISADGTSVAFWSSATNLTVGDTNGAEDIFVRDLASPTAELASVAVGGGPADAGSSWVSISADGRYVAFQSWAANLVAGDGNGFPDIFVRDRTSHTTTLVSVDSDGNQADDQSEKVSISGDGRYVAFCSYATNLVADDTNGSADIFVHDCDLDTTERVSVAGNGDQADGQSYELSISGDGRVVAFLSEGSNLVTGDANSTTDVFVRDRQEATTERDSVTSGGPGGNGESYAASASADGRLVAFASDASNLMPGDTNGVEDIFVRDRQSGAIERVSVDGGGGQADGRSDRPSISADGRWVVFRSFAASLVAGDTNGRADIFVHDRQTGATARASVASGGTQADSGSEFAEINAEGRYVVFTSNASNLVAGDTNGVEDVFLRDLQTDVTERVSVDGGGAQANGLSWACSISADGRYIAFASEASNLVLGDTNTVLDIFVRDRQEGTIERVSVATGGPQADSFSDWPSISADGRYVAFQSEASNLVAGDTAHSWDVFVRDRVAGTTECISVSPDGDLGDNSTVRASITDDGRYVAFMGGATNLVAGDTNDATDVFVRDLQTDVTERVSVASDDSQAVGASSFPSISADGRYAAFGSLASNLMAGDTNGVADVFIRTRW